VRTSRDAWTIIREGFGSNLMAMALSTLGGAVLNSRVEALLALPALLAMAPPLADMAGDFGTVIGARLATALKLGYIRPRVLYRSPVLRKNVVAVLITGLFASLYLGVAVLTVSFISGIPLIDPMKLIGVGFISGTMLVVVTIVFGVALSAFSMRRGRDPADTTIPIITSVADMIGAIFLLLAALLLNVI